MGRPGKYSPEFREQAAELVRATGKTVAEVARDLSINDTTWWSLATTALACAFALAAADPRRALRCHALASRPAIRALLGTRNTDICSGSSWTRVFAMYDDHLDGPGDAVVGALLEDGVYVQGGPQQPQP